MRPPPPPLPCGRFLDSVRALTLLFSRPTLLVPLAPPAIAAAAAASVAPRSGLAYKKGIDVGAGVIDEDYRGEVGVILFNFGEEDFEVAPGDRIAQLILERIATPDVEVVSDLDATDRGAGGFGSTGVKA